MNADQLTPRRLLRRPLHKDWIMWLWMVALVAVVQPTIGRHTYSDFNGKVTTVDVTLLIDLAMSFGIQTLLFMLLPAAIRRHFARKGLKN